MKQNFTYTAPALKSTESRRYQPAYDESFELFESKQYAEAVRRVLDHFNPSLRMKYGDSEGRSYHIPHGSILVHIEIGDKDLVVSAPFLALPAGSGRVPMLRRVAELNLSDLDLPHFVLQGNELSLHYRCPLELCQPHKIGYMLRELCITGDKYDDEFVHQFGASRIYTPIVQPYDEIEERRICTAIRDCCHEMLEAIEEKTRKRDFRDAWFILMIALYRIHYIANPQALLESELAKALDKADRDDVPNSELVAEGIDFLKSLVAKTDEELKQSIYKVETISSGRRSSDIENIRSNIKEPYEYATQAYSSGNTEHCTLRCLHICYRIYFFNNLQEDINKLLSNALKASAGLAFPQAASILLQALKSLMEDWDEDENEDAFFSERDMIDALPRIQTIQKQLLEEMDSPYVESYMQYVRKMMLTMKDFC